MEKVLVTGMGMISPLGIDLDSSWNSLINGVSGVGPITLFDSTGFMTRIAAEVDSKGLAEAAAKRIKKRVLRQMTRPTAMSFMAAQMAVEDSGLDFSKFEPHRCAIVIGAAGSDYPAEKMANASEFDESRIIKAMANAYPAWISLHYNLEGPSMTVATACSSASYAMSIAYDYIAYGVCDAAITGGACGSILPEYMAGFSDMMALSQRNENPTEASCPFDKKRDGFVMGEGAGILILESEASARKRGARVYAEIRRPALLSEGYNMIAPKKDGEGMAACISRALSLGKLNVNDVDYINAHGTSTQLNDLNETMAIKKVFGNNSRKLCVSSTKSMTGHCLAAAGGIEAVITCKSIAAGVVPPTINLYDTDPQLDLDYVPNCARELRIDAALSNSFAFGGHNAVVPFVKYN